MPEYDDPPPKEHDDPSRAETEHPSSHSESVGLAPRSSFGQQFEFFTTVYPSEQGRSGQRCIQQAISDTTSGLAENRHGPDGFASQLGGEDELSPLSQPLDGLTFSPSVHGPHHLQETHALSRSTSAPGNLLHVRPIKGVQQPAPSQDDDPWVNTSVVPPSELHEKHPAFSHEVAHPWFTSFQINNYQNAPIDFTEPPAQYELHPITHPHFGLFPLQPAMTSNIYSTYSTVAAPILRRTQDPAGAVHSMAKEANIQETMDQVIGPHEGADQEPSSAGVTRQKIAIPGAATGYHENGKRRRGAMPQPEQAMHHLLRVVQGQDVTYYSPEQLSDSLREDMTQQVKDHIVDVDRSRKTWSCMTREPQSKSK